MGSVTMNPIRTLIIAAVASTAHAAEIPAGTHLLLRMEHSISTRAAKPGDGVHLKTVTPINAGGKIVVPVCSYGQDLVTQAKRGGRVHGQAELQIQLVTLILPSGEVLKISPRTSSLETDEGTHPAQQRGTMESQRFGGVLGFTLAGTIAGGRTGARIGSGAVIAKEVIFAILARGKEMELRKGTEVDVVFAQPVNIE